MERFDYSPLLKHSEERKIDVEEDIKRINIVLEKHNLTIEDVVITPSVVSFIVGLELNSKIQQILKLEQNFGIACKDNNVRVYVDGDKLFIEKKTPNGIVNLGDLYTSDFISDRLKLMIGIDNHGEKVYYDIEKAPHMLVAGTTGSGKSIFLHSVILSLLMNHPDDVDIIGIDPKQTEFNFYAPLDCFNFISDSSTAIETLYRLCDEMESRYTTLSQAGCRDIDEYNGKTVKMQRIVCIIDEFADLILTEKKVEQYVVRLAQKARACGIHLVIATQRPSADIITGLIKANIPTRVCFAVKSSVDSRIILDETGGEKLSGRGDILFQANGAFHPVRAQGCYIELEEKNSIRACVYYQNYKMTIRHTSPNGMVAYDFSKMEYI